MEAYCAWVEAGQIAQNRRSRWGGPLRQALNARFLQKAKVRIARTPDKTETLNRREGGMLMQCASVPLNTALHVRASQPARVSRKYPGCGACQFSDLLARVKAIAARRQLTDHDLRLFAAL